MNIKKCKYMIITSPQKPKTINSIDLCVNGRPLGMCDSIKYLGVIIDNNLDWKTHINTVCKKVSKILEFSQNLVIILISILSDQYIFH